MRLLSILMGIFFAVLLLIFAEILVRQLPFSENMGEYQIRGFSPPPLAPAPTHIPIHLPPPSQKVSGEHYRFVPHQRVIYPLGYVHVDDEVGLTLGPNLTTQISRLTMDGRPSYRVTYHSDSQGRRVTPGQEPGRPRNLFFLGCSFTYGEGLEDKQTFPAQVAIRQKLYQVYNYSFHGWGAGNLLRLVHKDGFAQDVSKTTKGKAIYLFIDEHIPRVIGSLNLYRAVPDWTENLPYYYLDSDGKLQGKGMIADSRWWTEPIFLLFSQSRLLTYLKVDFPRANISHIELFSAIVADMRDILKEKMNGMELIVLFFPGSQANKYLIPYLDKKGIASLDYSSLDVVKYLGFPGELPDGHPNAAMDEFLAKQVVRDLQLKDKSGG